MEISSTAAGSGAHSPARSTPGVTSGCGRIHRRMVRPLVRGTPGYAERRRRAGQRAQAETDSRTVSPAIVHPLGGVSRAACSEQSSTKLGSGRSRSGLSSISRASYLTTAVVDEGTEQPILEQVRTTGMLDHRDVISSNGGEVAPSRSTDPRRNPRWSRDRPDKEMYSAVAAGSPLWSPRSTRTTYPGGSVRARADRGEPGERVTGRAATT